MCVPVIACCGVVTLHDVVSILGCYNNNLEYIKNRAILATTNDIVEDIITYMVALIPNCEKYLIQYQNV
jgi:hypothetical protein